MRRFIESIVGKAVSFLVIFALLVPLLTLSMSSSAMAQLDVRTQWAVLEFADNSRGAIQGLGKVAQEAVSSELSARSAQLIKGQEVALTPPESIDRTMSELGYEAPVTRSDQMNRLGQRMGVQAIVSGEIVNYRVRKVNGGKQADVKMRVVVTDVASGLTFNGAALQTNSSVRTGEVDDETLINDAIGAGAYTAVSEIISRSLPRGTVLNTLDKRALINKGARSGFTPGQKVIVTRGREEVSRGTVTDVEPDQSFMTVNQIIKGIQPGDKVTVIFDVPELSREWSRTGDPGVKRARTSGNTQPLIGVAVAAFVLAFLLGGGGGSNGQVIDSVTARATMAGGSPAVKVSWRPGAFIKGNKTRLRWQVYRSDNPFVPIMSVPGNQTSFIDTPTLGAMEFGWYDFSTEAQLPCNPELPDEKDGTYVPLVAGTPYTYSVDLIWAVSGLDDPMGGENEFCYGQTDKTTSKGTATPLQPVQLLAPAADATLSTPQFFQVNSTQTNPGQVTLEYVLQFSTSASFASGSTNTVATWQEPASSLAKTPSVVTQVLTNPTDSQGRIFWRVGVRNISDSPGPLGNYIFSDYRIFKRPVPPPPP